MSHVGAVRVVVAVSRSLRKREGQGSAGSLQAERGPHGLGHGDGALGADDDGGVGQLEPEDEVAGG